MILTTEEITNAWSLVLSSDQKNVALGVDMLRNYIKPTLQDFIERVLDSFNEQLKTFRSLKKSVIRDLKGQLCHFLNDMDSSLEFKFSYDNFTIFVVFYEMGGIKSVTIGPAKIESHEDFNFAAYAEKIIFHTEKLNLGLGTKYTSPHVSLLMINREFQNFLKDEPKRVFNDFMKYTE